MSFSGIRKLCKKTIKIFFENDENIVVTEDHKFENCVANELSINDSLYNRKYGKNLKIIKIEDFGFQDVYDVLDVDGNNLYYTNDFISHNCEFTGSIQTIINALTLERLDKEWIEPLEIEFDEKLKIYERPEKDFKYILGVDPAKGTGKNSSCIQVLKVISTDPLRLKQVAVFKDNKTDPFVFSRILNRLGIWYNMRFSNDWK